MADNERQRDKLLPPGTFAHVLDGTTAQIKTYRGPVAMSLTGQDRAVVFNPTKGTFDEVAHIDQAVQKIVVIPEGSYGVLKNPAKDSTTRPEPGKGQNSAELLIGETENLKGPQSLALWPMQSIEVREGHHLRSNEYLLIGISSEEKARQNWTKAVIKSVADKLPDGSTPPADAGAASKEVPTDLAMGRKYNILGTEVAFYIPPTGVEVVPEAIDSATGAAIFVRQAETLEQLEYSILVDENGNKDYPKGPSVVFPKPTQEFLVARKPDGSVIADENGLPLRKFKAIEMNALQGIQLKFAKSGELVYANGDKEPYSAGDEKFVTGAKMPIYYPEEGHTLVRYDGKTIHYAVAVTEGEAKYVLVRETGNVKLVPGPTMLLPDPVKETIVWRPLSEREARTWFPGSSGQGSEESITWNAKLRQEASNSPTTRQGVVSEGQLDKGGPPAMYYSLNSNASPEAFLGASLERGASYSKGVQTRARSSSMQESRQGKDQQAVVGDVAERKSTYNEPRTIILGGRVKGVPTIKVQPGYAVNVIKSDGRRDAVVGPKTILMGFSDTLDILRLSTGKPKNTDRLFETVYLNVYNNKVTDIIDDVETSDHVVVSLKLIYTVNFEGDASKWFTIENYVKHLCDHVRSVLKGAIRKLTIEEFYRNSSDIIRDIILGVKAANTPTEKDAPVTLTKRPGMFFAENGMRITDVDALKTQIADAGIAALLAKSQQDVVRQNIELGLKQKALEVTQKYQTIERLSAEAVWTTEARKLELEALKVDGGLKLSIAQIDAEKSKTEEEEELQKLMNALEDLKFTAQLNRNIAAGEATEALKLKQQEREVALLDKQVEAVKAQMLAIQPGLIEALNSVSAKETLIKVAGEMSFHQMFGAGNALEFIQSTFAGSPLQGVIASVIEKAALAANGTVKNPNIPQSQA